MSEFRINLRKLRKENHLTQTKLGAMLHYGYTAIANYESGRNQPSLDDLIKLSEIFDVTTDELLGVEKREKPVFLQSFEKLSAEKQKIILELMESLQALP